MKVFKHLKTKKVLIPLCTVFIIIAALTIIGITQVNGEITETKLGGITDESVALSWDTDKVTVYIDTSMTDDDGNTITMYVPIPEGYTVSDVSGETTVKEGLVIYEGEDKVSTDSDAKTTRNQWVWIPVDADDVYWTDTDGKIYGIRYTFSSDGTSTTNGTYEPYVPTSNSYKYYYEDYYLDNYKSSIDSHVDLLTDMQTDFEAMIESIKTYGGFYIGRYELGDNDATSSRGTSSGVTSTPVEMQGKQVYNYITWYQAYDLCKEMSGTSETVETNMIWGALWDTTLNFLVETGDKTYSEIVDSTTWGNHSDSTGDAATDSGTLRTTGYSEYWKACNIYDLAGNVYEWTLEAYSASYRDRYYRGGYYNNSGSSYPSSNRFNVYPINSFSHVGTRPLLYIK